MLFLGKEGEDEWNLRYVHVSLLRLPLSASTACAVKTSGWEARRGLQGCVSHYEGNLMMRIDTIDEHDAWMSLTQDLVRCHARSIWAGC